jgi:hypothetical protein
MIVGAVDPGVHVGPVSAEQSGRATFAAERPGITTVRGDREFIRAPLLRSAAPIRPSAPPSVRESSTGVARSRNISSSGLVASSRFADGANAPTWSVNGATPTQLIQASLIRAGPSVPLPPNSPRNLKLNSCGSALDAEPRAPEVGAVREIARARHLALARPDRAAPEVDRERVFVVLIVMRGVELHDRAQRDRGAAVRARDRGPAGHQAHARRILVGDLRLVHLLLQLGDVVALLLLLLDPLAQLLQLLALLLELLALSLVLLALRIELGLEPLEALLHRLLRVRGRDRQCETDEHETRRDDPVHETSGRPHGSAMKPSSWNFARAAGPPRNCTKRVAPLCAPRVAATG